MSKGPLVYCMVRLLFLEEHRLHNNNCFFENKEINYSELVLPPLNTIYVAASNSLRI